MQLWVRLKFVEKVTECVEDIHQRTEAYVKFTGLPSSHPDNVKQNLRGWNSQHPVSGLQAFLPELRWSRAYDATHEAIPQTGGRPRCHAATNTKR